MSFSFFPFMTWRSQCLLYRTPPQMGFFRTGWKSEKVGRWEGGRWEGEKVGRWQEFLSTFPLSHFSTKNVKFVSYAGHRCKSQGTVFCPGKKERCLAGRRPLSDQKRILCRSKKNLDKTKKESCADQKRILTRPKKTLRRPKKNLDKTKKDTAQTKKEY